MWRGDTAMPGKQNITEEGKFLFHIVQDDLFVDLNLYQFGWEKCRPLHQWGPGVRGHFLFHYVISGKGKLEANYEIYTIEAGQGFLLCPQQISTYYADRDDPWTYAWVEFDGLRARECMTLAGLSERQHIYTPGAKYIHNRLEQYFMNLIDAAGQPPMLLVGLGMVLLNEIVQTSKTKVASSNKRLREFYLKEALGFIDGNYQRDISIEDIAAASGLNRSYFGRIFKESMGKSPQQFLITYRMSKAAELLKSSKLSIAEVSSSVGYRNQLHFSNAFKTTFGISPREYRSKYYLGDGSKNGNSV